MRQWARLLESNNYEAIVNNLIKSSPKIFLLKVTIAFRFANVFIKLVDDPRIDKLMSYCEQNNISGIAIPRIYKIRDKYLNSKNGK